MMITLRFGDVAGAFAYHAALVTVAAGMRGRILRHAHADFYEMFCVVAGRGVHIVDEAEQSLKAGDLVLVRPSDRHAFTGIGPEGLRFINVAFAIPIWRAFTDVAGVTAVHIWDRMAGPPSVALGSQQPFMAEEFQRILEAFHRRPRALDLIRLCSHVLPVLEREQDGEGGSGLPGWLVHACTAMAVEENLQAGLPRLLELAAVSHGHLDRVMRARYGRTPVDYVTERRLAHAAVLLTTTTESVGRIASRCGFASTSYFGRRFRQRYGTSPREYRHAASQMVVPAAAIPWAGLG